MKKSISAVLMVVLLSVMAVHGQEKYLTAPVSHVTVFKQGAQLYGEIPINLQPGTIDLVAGNLSPFIDAGSIQVKGEGDFMILGVNHRNNFLENPGESEQIKELREKIDALVAKIEDEKTSIDVMLEKELFLKANYDLVTNKTTVTSEQLKSFFDFFTVNTEAVRFGILKKRRLLREYEKEKQQLENQMATTVDKSKLPTGEIVITVSNTRPVTGKLKLSYVVMNAGWNPAYDIRVDEITAPASIIYKANVWQNSGIEWKGVKLSLSNASPMTSGALPTLYPWFIDIYYPRPMAKSLQSRDAYAPSAAKRQQEAEEMFMVAEESAAMPVSITESSISFSFDINVPQTISSGGKPEIVELQRLTVPATFSYGTIPKINNSAFLMGYITGWEKYNLLPGESNIYFSNTFTGKGYINTAELTDTLPVSLGADNGITVRRDKRVDFSSHKMIGTNRVETLSFLISIRNNKKQTIDLKLRDQIPLSQNSSITVEATELTGGRLNQATGEITWDIRIAPQETKEIVLTYTVRYPKNQKVILE